MVRPAWQYCGVLPVFAATQFQRQEVRVVLSDIRMKGLFQVTWASALFAVFLALGYWLDSMGWHHLPWEFAIPAGFALAGLLQAITGIPFVRFASQWDSLRPWQRGVLGIGIVLASFALLFAAGVAYVSYQGTG